MKLNKNIILDYNELHQECIICKEKYDIDHHEPDEIYEKTPILTNCGHSICYECYLEETKKLSVKNKTYEGVT